MWSKQIATWLESSAFICRPVGVKRKTTSESILVITSMMERKERISRKVQVSSISAIMGCWKNEDVSEGSDRIVFL